MQSKILSFISILSDFVSYICRKDMDTNITLDHDYL